MSMSCVLCYLKLLYLQIRYQISEEQSPNIRLILALVQELLKVFRGLWGFPPVGIWLKQTKGDVCSISEYEQKQTRL